VWQRVRETFWMYLGTTLLFALLFVMFYVAMLIPLAIFGAISPVLVFLGFLGLACALVYLLISASLVFIIRANERLGFFEALTRSFKLVRNKWWSTFGLIIILYFIMGVISYIPLIPMYAALFINTMHSVEANPFETSTSWELWTTVFFTAYYLLQMLLNTLPQIGIAFQYYNLVELKEAKSLLSDIGTIGQATAQERPEEQY